MNVFDATLIGIVQGLTEFIPVSSSGHLILVRDVLGITVEGSLAFDAVLHFATALAVLVYFRRDVLALITRAREQATLWWALILGTIPAVIFGFFFEGLIEQHLRTSLVVVSALIAGSVLFVIAERVSSFYERRCDATNAAHPNKRQKGYGSQVTTRKGLIIGLFQSLALIPGVSRAGASISGGLLFGLDREAATRFAFLLGFPVFFGVGVFKLFEIGAASAGAGTALLPLALSSLVSFVVGLAAIHFMITFLRNHKLYIFAVYRVLLALLVLLFI